MTRDDCDVKSMHSLNCQSAWNATPHNDNGTGSDKRFTSKRPVAEKMLTGKTALEVTDRERNWLNDFRQGFSATAIAYREGVSVPV